MPFVHLENATLYVCLCVYSSLSKQSEMRLCLVSVGVFVNVTSTSQVSEQKKEVAYVRVGVGFILTRVNVGEKRMVSRDKRSERDIRELRTKHLYSHFSVLLVFVIARPPIYCSVFVH